MKHLQRILLMMVLFVCIQTNTKAQFTVLDTIEWDKTEFVKKNIRKLTRRNGKDFTNQYKHYLSVPHVDLKNLNLTPELFFSNVKVLRDTVFASIKENPTIENIVLGENYKRDILVYNDSLKCYWVMNSYIGGLIYQTQEILKYYLNLDADLLFHIWGRTLDEYFVLMDNRIYMLKYDDETQSCKLTGF